MEAAAGSCPAANFVQTVVSHQRGGADRYSLAAGLVYLHRLTRVAEGVAANSDQLRADHAQPESVAWGRHSGQSVPTVGTGVKSLARRTTSRTGSADRVQRVTDDANLRPVIMSSMIRRGVGRRALCHVSWQCRTASQPRGVGMGGCDCQLRLQLAPGRQGT
jgi:hypothetical protein